MIRDITTPVNILKDDILRSHTNERIFRETAQSGFPEPSIIELGLRVHFVFPLSENIEVNKSTQLGVESGVESPMAMNVLRFLTENPLSKSEIAKCLGKPKPTRYLNDLMAKLLRRGYVEYTIPEKPNSRLQKYRMTEKGKHVLQKRDEN